MGRRQVAETCLKLGKQKGSLWAGRGRPVLLGFRASRLKTSWGGVFLRIEASTWERGKAQ